MAKNSAPDPRFDPRFQRGYDGPEPDAPPTPTPGRLSPAGAGGSSVPPPPEPGAAHEIIAAQDAVGPSESTDAPDNVFWVPPRRNPYGIALLAGGLVMIAVGLWLVWSVVTASSFPDGYDRAAQAFQVVQQQLTPAFLLAGVLGIVGWLVLGALGSSTRGRD
jgi:hypothetical protein